ncbi:MAG TPA: glycogen synthase GlgA [Vicinamibacterales bacterium]|nr:glycogen synthase GlgA [Vicinamibacterales bacterium]
MDPSLTDSHRVPRRKTIAGRAPRMRVLMVASEVAPWAKTGGLADVLGALPEALERLGHRTTVVVPKYRGVDPPRGEVVPRRVWVGSTAHDLRLHVAALSPRRRVVFVDAPRLFDRDGYYTTGGVDYPDNAERFAVLSAAALDVAHSGDARVWPDVIHAHDWQTGLVPLLLRTTPERWPALASAGLVFTIHNLAYQGSFPRETVPALGLPWSVFTMEHGEFWDKFSFLKAGITSSDVITTVSPTYARETQRREFGCGLDGVLAARADRYVGILNGIDTRVWNPETDPYLPASYSSGDLSGKLACKRALLTRFGLPVGDDAVERPVVGMVSRLVDQKGLALIERAREALLALDATFVFVGTGDARYERWLRALSARYPTRVAAFIGFDEPLAHLVEAGADLFLMPSLFEPCGLNQMYSLRYGTVPVVRAVGGLDDTVQPYTARARHATGFKFREASADELVRTLRQALRVFRDRAAWARLVSQGMAEDHSWETSAREYVKVYRRARREGAARAALTAAGPETSERGERG